MSNWNEICPKCLIGAIEPDCEFYGKPRGCNAPTFGEHPQSHNAAAMREALITCRNIAAWIRSGNASVEAGVERIQTEIDKALSAPARNCDVGTAEEQAERFEKHCQSFLNREGIKACVGCPCCGVVMYGKCELACAQMPYESEVEK